MTTNTENQTTECIAEGHDMGDCCDIDCPDKGEPLATDDRPLPRRVYLDRHTPAELAIREAVDAVEAAGAHPHLTKAVVLLAEARNAVADFVDGVPVFEPTTKTTALEEIAAERKRQISKGHTPYLDDKQYLYQLRDKVDEHVMSSRETTGMTEERAHLVSAAALLVAEIERMDRSRLPQHLFRVDDGEHHWIIARDKEDVLEIFVDQVDKIGDAEKDELKITLIPAAEPITIFDGATKTTKTASEWALEGRGVIASTCE